MTTIHVRPDGLIFRASLRDGPSWIFGSGASWREAIGSLVYQLEGTSWMEGVRLDLDLNTPQPLDGMAPENACQCHTDTSPALDRRLAELNPTNYPVADFFRPANAMAEAIELAERHAIENTEGAGRAAEWQIP